MPPLLNLSALPRPITALAPMQDVTTLPFMRIIAHYGAPDLFFTEFFRVHSQSRPEKHILPSLLQNDTGAPVIAQLIGENIPSLIGTSTQLLTTTPAAGIDLNLGCPAPKVYKKNVGGGLLRDPKKIDEILSALRASINGNFTVKMRIGFGDTQNFETILDLINTHKINLLTLHARTVSQLYRGPADHSYTTRAVQRLSCPVLANGEIATPEIARQVLQQTNAAGVMIGRHAIRNPWIFRQCRQLLSGQEPDTITLAHVRDYIDRLLVATHHPGIPDRAHVGCMKKFLNFIGLSVDPEGNFLRATRLAGTSTELQQVCDRHLLSNPNKPYSLAPYPTLIARPNCED